jgi:hypothetical protein
MEGDERGFGTKPLSDSPKRGSFHLFASLTANRVVLLQASSQHWAFRLNLRSKPYQAALQPSRGRRRMCMLDSKWEYSHHRGKWLCRGSLKDQSSGVSKSRQHRTVEMGTVRSDSSPVHLPFARFRSKDRSLPRFSQAQTDRNTGQRQSLLPSALGRNLRANAPRVAPPAKQSHRVNAASAQTDDPCLQHRKLDRIRVALQSPRVWFGRFARCSRFSSSS